MTCDCGQQKQPVQKMYLTDSALYSSITVLYSMLQLAHPALTAANSINV